MPERKNNKFVKFVFLVLLILMLLFAILPLLGSLKQLKDLCINFHLSYNVTMNDSEFTFKGQRPDERVRLVIRRHPIVFFAPLFKSTIALALATVSFVYFDLSTIFYIVGGLALLFTFSELFKIWFIYSNSFCLVTNQRLINIDQRGFFDRDITETDFSKIQDVTNKTSGVLGTTLNFGIITIQTAGTQNQLVIKNIADPYQIQQEITKNIRQLLAFSFQLLVQKFEIRKILFEPVRQAQGKQSES